MGKVLQFEDTYNEIVITGGEPLLSADFLKGFLELFRFHRKKEVYLETNGTLPEELKKIVDNVDIIAMDFKLPSSTGDKGDVWEIHEEFASTAVQKELIIKAIVTDNTSMDDIKRMGCVIGALKGEPEVVLQPVTPVNASVKEPDGEMLLYFKKYLEKTTGNNVMILGQFHKKPGIR